MKKQAALISLSAVLGVLFAATLACSQAGEILTPAEATARAMPTAAPTASGEVVGTQFSIGDTVEFVSSGYLVPIYQKPGDRTAFSHAARGDTGTVIGSEMVGDVLWYHVDSVAGLGWVQNEYIAAVGGEGGGGKFQPGSTAYLTGKGYLINLVEAPGSLRMIAGQERGVEVTIVETSVYEGANWYLVDAPTGQGWVSEENLSMEKP